MNFFQLAIANKNYSSWSLRAWLALTHFQIPFEEKLIPLDQSDTAKNIKQISPSGFVPALNVNHQFTVWDSLAICEFLAETFPKKTCGHRILKHVLGRAPSAMKCIRVFRSSGKIYR